MSILIDMFSFPFTSLLFQENVRSCFIKIINVLIILYFDVLYRGKDDEYQEFNITLLTKNQVYDII